MVKIMNFMSPVQRSYQILAKLQQLISPDIVNNPVDKKVFDLRTPAQAQAGNSERGIGRELFAGFRATALSAEEGGGVLRESGR